MSQERYRTWSESQEDLPLFWQPRWLDIVDEDWNAEFYERHGKVRAVWPYVPIRKLGLSLITWPSCTPYLGPWFTTEDTNQSKPLTYRYPYICEMILN